jgi:peroxiredoxin
MLPGAKSLEGKRVPNVTFKTRTDGQWKDVTTDDVLTTQTVSPDGQPSAEPPETMAN